MLRRLLRRLFGENPEPDDIVEEKWKCGFSSLRKRRFREETGEDFEALRRGGQFRLVLKKKNLFAWALHEPYRYRNAVMEMEISFGPDNGHSAAGMMFRYISGENYYYALVSNRGMFRFDVVFNGNPIPLIPWMELGLPAGMDGSGGQAGQNGHGGQNGHAGIDRFSLRVIAHGSSFSFYLNDEWIAELDDEMLDAGHIAFCAQNYDEKSPSEFDLHRMMIESRPVEVEYWYYRRTRFLPVEPRRRIALAERLNSRGQFAAALIQLKKAFRRTEPDGAAFFMMAETCLNLEMYGEAFGYLEACLEKDPSHTEARIEKANLLYLQNRFLDAKEYLSGLPENFSDRALLHNLTGNVEYALGNYVHAADAYRRAIELGGESSVFQMNAARACDRAGRTQEAEVHYAEAARLLFREEAWQELPEIFSRIPDHPVVRAVRGKILFQEGKLEEAEKLFLALIEEGTAESEVDFLEGLVHVQRGDHRGALDFFETAIEKQPDFFLYRLKKAESRYHLGEDPEEALTRARELNPEDGWVHNLTGLVALEQGRYEEALAAFETAEKLLPGEEEIRINLSEVLAGTGETSRAFEMLEAESGAVLNQRGNLFARENRLDEAVDSYRRAVQLEPDMSVFRENLAAALWDAGLINEAEEHLARLLETESTPRAYELIGQIAFEKGQYARAVSAWRAGLDIDPSSLRLKLLQARGLLYSGDVGRAREIAESLFDTDMDRDAREIADKVREISEERFECAVCHREWWVRKDLPVLKQVRLVGDPPREMPAGKCPSCGKVYCVGCVLEHMKNNRFVCPDCGEPLKLLENGLRHLAMQYVEESG